VEGGHLVEERLDPPARGGRGRQQVAHGGSVVLAPVTIGTAGRFARFFDPDGNSFGLWQARAATVGDDGA